MQVDNLGAENPLTKLVVDLSGIDPDDAFSTCPYEKGHTFLFFLEKLLGAGKPSIKNKLLRLLIIKNLFYS